MKPSSSEDVQGTLCNQVSPVYLASSVAFEQSLPQAANRIKPVQVHRWTFLQRQLIKSSPAAFFTVDRPEELAVQLAGETRRPTSKEKESQRTGVYRAGREAFCTVGGRICIRAFHVPSTLLTIGVNANCSSNNKNQSEVSQINH